LQQNATAKQCTPAQLCHPVKSALNIDVGFVQLPNSEQMVEASCVEAGMI